MSKGHHQCSILPSKVSVKGSFDKSPFNVFNDIKGSIKGSDAGRLSALPGDRRQSASGLKVAEESFPGELGNALAMLESMKCGRRFGGKATEGQFVCLSIAMVALTGPVLHIVP